MYGWDTLVLLKHLLEQGLKKTTIAERLGISRRLVYHLIATGQLERDLSVTPPPRTRTPAAAKLEPYKAIVTTRLATYPELSAVRLFEECRAAGYTGGLTQLKVFVREVRPRSEPEPIIRFETPPAHQAQVDFAEFRFPWGKRYALLVVLGYSRLLWLKFYPRQTMATVISGLEDAFAYFGGVPAELLFDQMKAVIIDDQRAPTVGSCSKIRSSFASPRTGTFGSAPVGRIARRRKARWSGPCGISAITSSTGASFSVMAISMRSVSGGSTRRRMCGSTGRRKSRPASASSATSGRRCARSLRIPTAPCSSRRSERRKPRKPCALVPPSTWRSSGAHSRRTTWPMTRHMRVHMRSSAG